MRVAPHLTAMAVFATAPLAAQSTPLWRYTTTAPISFVRVTPLGTVVVATADRLVGLDPESGFVKWKRDDLKNLEPRSYGAIRESPFATVRVGGQVELIDLATGATKWRMPPPGGVQPYLPIPERGLILAYGENDSLRPVLVAADLATGAVRWEHVQPFHEAPEAVGQDYVGLQAALWVSDTTFILYVSKDGPVLVHAGTGEWLWRGDSLQGKKPPAPGRPPRSLLGLRRGQGTMVLADSVVYVPFENRLQAIRTRDGTPLWAEAAGLPTPVAQLEVTAQGIVVRCQPGPGHGSSLDLIDPATGASRWRKQVKGLDHVTPFVVSEGRVYIAANKKLLAVSLHDGARTEVARFEFAGGEEPFQLERRGNDLLLIGHQNLLLIDSTGTERYHAYHPAPGRSTLSKVALGALTVIEAVADLAQTDWSSTTLGCGCMPYMTYPDLGKRFAASEQARDYVYSVAHEEDSTGHKRPVFLRLHKDDGRVVGRVWLEEKRPDYQLDRIAGKLYVSEGDTEIVAFQM